MSTPHVRVRFAPSPTGWLHVGGARTAYFNWLFARQHRRRVRAAHRGHRRRALDGRERARRARRPALAGTCSGTRGPTWAARTGPIARASGWRSIASTPTALLARGRAYRCFCTDAELEVRRAAALAAGRPPQYDGRCRAIPREESAARAARGRAVRASASRCRARDWMLHDAVRGEVTFPAGMVGDFVLLRSSGLPTYNFACVVDDHLMAISHVLRAEEHLANTPRQLMLYEALGGGRPSSRTWR